jgi:lipopolysaccharide export system permease protein
MTRIDRYILGLYIRILLICFASLAGLLILIHIFANLDEFAEYSRLKKNALIAFASYYGPFLLSVFDRLSGLLGLTTVLFVVAWLYRTNELTAIQAAGISKRRVMRSLLVASVLLFTFAAVSRELIIPRFAGVIGKDFKDLVGESPHQIRPIFDEEYGMLIGGRHLQPKTLQIIDPIFRLEGPASKYGRQLSARSARYLESNDGPPNEQDPIGKHPRGFLVYEILTPTDMDSHSSIVTEGGPVLLTAKDTPGLAVGQCFVASSVRYDLLQSTSNWSKTVSTVTLIQRLRRDAQYCREDVRMTLHSRFVQPFLDATLLLLGLPIVLKRQDRHLFWIAGAGITVVAGFTIFVMTFQVIGASGTFISPSTAVWAPLLALMPIAWVRSKFALDS